MMLIPTKNILAVKRHMLEKRCIVVEDSPKGNHPVLNIPNLQVLNIMKSLVSKRYVKKTFCWRHGYYFLEDAAVDVLKDQLCMSDDEIGGLYVPSSAASNIKAQ